MNTSANPIQSDEAAAAGTHDAVLRTLLQHVPSLAGLRVVDLPCGRGRFSAQLQSLGADVTAVDIVLVEPFMFDRERLLLGDANQGLQFADASIDVLISIEGAEHFENPSFFMREIRRILKPGGTAIISTPNVNSLWSRWECFRRGYHSHFQPVSDTEKKSGHMLPVDAVFLRGAAERAGLQLHAVATTVPIRKTRFWQWAEPRLQKRLPAWVRNSPLAFGEVAIYVFSPKK